MVFQDPYASLNPRQTVRRTLEDPLRLHGVTAKSEIDGRVAAMLRHVGLRPEQAGRYPHEFSGGQRQRIGIARALILNPKIVICDEPVSALDVSIRAQIINLLLELKDTLGLSYIMISHDLGVVEHMSDRVAVMYLGRIVETGDWREIFERPAHPYTQTLISAIPDPLRRAPLATTSGELPNPLDPPGDARSRRAAVTPKRCVVARPGHRSKPVPTDTRCGAGEPTRSPVRRRWPRAKARSPHKRSALRGIAGISGIPDVAALNRATPAASCPEKGPASFTPPSFNDLLRPSADRGCCAAAPRRSRPRRGT